MSCISRPTVSFKNIKQLLINLSLITLSILLCLIVCEISLRTFGYKGNHERTRSTFDEAYGEVFDGSWIFSIDEEIASNNIIQINHEPVIVQKQHDE